MMTCAISEFNMFFRSHENGPIINRQDVSSQRRDSGHGQGRQANICNKIKSLFVPFGVFVANLSGEIRNYKYLLTGRDKMK